LGSPFAGKNSLDKRRKAKKSETTKGDSTKMLMELLKRRKAKKSETTKSDSTKMLMELLHIE